MSKIKKELKEIIKATMIPEVTSYLEDLHELLVKKEASKDDMDTIRDLESFLVELENVVLAINENKMNDEDANKIYLRILNLIEESNK